MSSIMFKLKKTSTAKSPKDITGEENIAEDIPRENHNASQEHIASSEPKKSRFRFPSRSKKHAINPETLDAEEEVEEIKEIAKPGRNIFGLRKRSKSHKDGEDPRELEFQALAIKLEETDRELLIMKQSLDSKTSLLDKTLKDHAELTAKFAVVEKENLYLKQRSVEATQTSEMESRIEQLSVRLTEKESQLKSQQSILAAAEERNRMLDRSLKGLQEQIDILAREKVMIGQSTQELLKGTQQELEKLVKENQAMQTLEKEKIVLNNSVLELSADIDQLKPQYQKALLDNQDLQKQLAIERERFKKESIEILEKSSQSETLLKQSEQEALEKSNLLQQKEDALENANKLLKQKDQDIENLRRLQSADAGLMHENSALKAQNTDLEQSISKVGQILEQTKLDLLQANQAVKEKTLETKSLNEKIQLLINENQQVSELLLSEKNRSQDLSVMLADSEKECEQTMTKLEMREIEVGKLLETLEETRNHIEKLSLEKEEAWIRCDRERRRVKKLKSQIRTEAIKNYEVGITNEQLKDLDGKYRDLMQRLKEDIAQNKFSEEGLKDLIQECEVI